MFSDQYLDKEENSKIQEVVFRWLTTDDITLNPIDAEDPEARLGNRDGCTCSLYRRLHLERQPKK